MNQQHRIFITSVCLVLGLLGCKEEGSFFSLNEYRDCELTSVSTYEVGEDVSGDFDVYGVTLTAEITSSDCQGYSEGVVVESVIDRIIVDGDDVYVYDNNYPNSYEIGTDTGSGDVNRCQYDNSVVVARDTGNQAIVVTFTYDLVGYCLPSTDTLKLNPDDELRGSPEGFPFGSIR